MKNAGAAVMGSATEEGEGRAIKAAEKAIASPLLNNVDIKGAQKILLSIMSGEDDELSMDELSEITEYIQERAGDEAEVIFGQGIDPELGKGIRVTVIATGFEMDRLTTLVSGTVEELQSEKKTIEVTEEAEPLKKVIHLESGKTSQIEEEVTAESAQTYTFTFQKPLFPTATESKTSIEATKAQDPKIEDAPNQLEDTQKEEVEFEFEIANGFESNKKSFTLEDEEEVPTSKVPVEEKQEENPAYSNDYYEQLKQKAIQRAHERFEKLKSIKSYNQNPEEFKDKLETPAYVRKQVKLNDVQHSSERSISRFNLTDDNEFLKNNRFLHDNVD
jgi:cell division protein FtsZ